MCVKGCNSVSYSVFPHFEKLFFEFVCVCCVLKNLVKGNLHLFSTVFLFELQRSMFLKLSVKEIHIYSAHCYPFCVAEEYVTCHTCRSRDTILQKDTRLFFLQCETCGSRCSVASIKTGFQAVTGKRAAIRAKTA
jgi:hypothetical protein